MTQLRIPAVYMRGGTSKGMFLRPEGLPADRAGRDRLLPDVPTLAESGLPGFETSNWQGVVVPGGTPRAIVDRLNKELNAILAMPEQRDAILSTASEVAGGTPEEFGALIRSEAAKWAEVVKAAKIQPE